MAFTQLSKSSQNQAIDFFSKLPFDERERLIAALVEINKADASTDYAPEVAPHIEKLTHLNILEVNLGEYFVSSSGGKILDMFVSFDWDTSSLEQVSLTDRNSRQTKSLYSKGDLFLWVTSRGDILVVADFVEGENLIGRYSKEIPQNRSEEFSSAAIDAPLQKINLSYSPIGNEAVPRLQPISYEDALDLPEDVAGKNLALRIRSVWLQQDSPHSVFIPEVAIPTDVSPDDCMLENNSLDVPGSFPQIVEANAALENTEGTIEETSVTLENTGGTIESKGPSSPLDRLEPVRPVSISPIAPSIGDLFLFITLDENEQEIRTVVFVAYVDPLNNSDVDIFNPMLEPSVRRINYGFLTDPKRVYPRLDWIEPATIETLSDEARGLEQTLAARETLLIPSKQDEQLGTRKDTADQSLPEPEKKIAVLTEVKNTPSIKEVLPKKKYVRRSLDAKIIPLFGEMGVSLIDSVVESACQTSAPCESWQTADSVSHDAKSLHASIKDVTATTPRNEAIVLFDLLRGSFPSVSYVEREMLLRFAEKSLRGHVLECMKIVLTRIPTVEESGITIPRDLNSFWEAKGASHLKVACMRRWFIAPEKDNPVKDQSLDGFGMFHQIPKAALINFINRGQGHKFVQSVPIRLTLGKIHPGQTLAVAEALRSSPFSVVCIHDALSMLGIGPRTAKRWIEGNEEYRSIFEARGIFPSAYINQLDDGTPYREVILRKAESWYGKLEIPELPAREIELLLRTSHRRVAVPSDPGADQTESFDETT